MFRIFQTVCNSTYHIRNFDACSASCLIALSIFLDSSCQQSHDSRIGNCVKRVRSGFFDDHEFYQTLIQSCLQTEGRKLLRKLCIKADIKSWLSRMKKGNQSAGRRTNLILIRNLLAYTWKCCIFLLTNCSNSFSSPNSRCVNSEMLEEEASGSSWAPVDSTELMNWVALQTLWTTL